jgi:hypothetical protein
LPPEVTRLGRVAGGWARTDADVRIPDTDDLLSIR